MPLCILFTNLARDCDAAWSLFHMYCFVAHFTSPPSGVIGFVILFSAYAAIVLRFSGPLLGDRRWWSHVSETFARVRARLGPSPRIRSFLPVCRVFAAAASWESGVLFQRYFWFYAYLPEGHAAWE